MRLLLGLLTAGLILSGSSYSARDSSARDADIVIPIISPPPTTGSELIEKSIDVIKPHEGLHLEAYKDSNRYSIGYGTISYYGEVIDEREAIKRLTEAVSTRADIVTSENTGSVNKLAALTSLLYNCPKCYNRVKKHPTKSLRLAHDKVCSGGVCKSVKGLTLRRQEERQLFTS